MCSDSQPVILSELAYGPIARGQQGWSNSAYRVTRLSAMRSSLLHSLSFDAKPTRTGRMFLQRMDELLDESFQRQRFESLTVDEEQDALRLARIFRDQVQSERDSIRSEYGEPS